MINKKYLTSIKTILEENEQLSAKQIAKVLYPELDPSEGKREVNRILYNYENAFFLKNQTNEWFLKKAWGVSNKMGRTEGFKVDRNRFQHNLIKTLLAHKDLDSFGLEERELNILKRIVVEGEKYLDIARYYSLTPERIRQIYIKTLEKIVDGFIELLNSYTEAKIRIETLEKECMKLLYENLSYQKAIRSAQKHFDIKLELTTKTNENSLLKLPVSELDLSVRALNCLRRAHIFTVGELIDYSVKDLLEIKNFGRLTLKEIKQELKGMNLTLK